MTEPFILSRPTAPEVPLLVSVPHTGVALPEGVAGRFASERVCALPDTDWHLDRLYEFVPQIGAVLCCARWSRYLIDLNRPADGHALYPGRAETELVPTRTFAGDPIYRDGEAPNAAEIAARTAAYWRPYHDLLRTELQRLRARFGYALLFDAHSIVSEVPRFAKSRLPGFMLGDVDGTSCDRPLADAVFDVLSGSGISAARNDPFKGGHITRAFGRPAEGIHALQLEMSQRLYMDEVPTPRFRDDLAAGLRVTLRAALLAFVSRRPARD
ncbi:MAG: N-formylglutamate deformylase [Planctomycetota bacterium]